METFKQLITERQSVRKYKPDAVTFENVMACVEAARLAPSACNAQPWTFIVVDDPALKNRVAGHAVSMGMNKFAVQAPVIVAIVLEKPNFTSKIGSVIKDKEYPLIDIGIAAEHFCLQATELGLGTCMIGWFNEKKVKEALGIPQSKRVPLLITLGYPDTTLRPKVRKPTERMCSRNKY